MTTYSLQDYFPNTMDARSYPRSQLSVPVDLHCTSRNCHLQGKIQDISAGGMFVMAPARARTGWQFDICMKFPSWKEAQHINAIVRRVAANGVGLQFLLDDNARQMLEEILLPDWDGDNVYEGLIIFAVRDSIVDFSQWLRLTSLVCNQYRRYARAHRLTKNGTIKQDTAG